MKIKKIQIVLLGACVLTGGIVLAQNGSQEPPDHPPRHHHRPPPPLILIALDANHDGILDAAEIANASAALLKLDKNGDGQLTLDELCPRCPKPGQEPDEPEMDGPPPFEPNR